MSQRRQRVSMAMLKGKPSTLSVPSIRFNPGEDDLKEYNEGIDADDGFSKPAIEFEQNKSNCLKETKHVLTSSSSADETKELSPAKENLQKLGKRSSSLDGNNSLESGSNDAWALFYEIKGKITKTMEEKWHIDLGSNGNNSQATEREKLNLQFEPPVDEPEIDDADECSPAVDAVELARDQKTVTSTSPSKKSPFTNSSPPPRSAHFQGSTLQALSADFKQRGTRFLAKSDTPSMSLSSLMATKLDDDDLLEEQLHEEYIREEFQQEDKIVPEAIQEDKPLPFELQPVAEMFDPVPKQVKTKKLLKHPFQNKWLTYGCILIVFFVMPIPPSVSGFILGAIISGVIVNFYYKLMSPSKSSEVKFSPDFKTLSAFQLPVISNKTTIVYKGWMNELRQPYNAFDYHISQTHSVYVRLEGNMLRISHPKGKIPKHASFNEARHDTSFFYQRYYNLAGCEVELLPLGLTKKRFWSRKYPICISLCENACKTCNVSSSPFFGENDEGNSPSGIPEVTAIGIQEERLFLFTRTCRDKEEWYWRFFMATKFN